MFPQTKFHRPQVRDEHVERSRLLDAIAASGARVVNVTAPAGFGKSTLLAQWAARVRARGLGPLDADDRGPRLWAAVLTGAARARRQVSTRRSTPPRRPDADLRTGVLIALLDALAARTAADARPRRPAPRADDGRDAREPGLGARAPARRAPGAARLAAATSALPSLARARIRGEVLDVRTDDLRFADDEAQRFLRERLGLRSTRPRSRRSTSAPRAGPRRSTWRRCGCGSATRSSEVIEQLGDEDLFGALTDEVLRSSPEHERRFIVETSVLDRFNAGPLRAAARRRRAAPSAR